MNQPVRCPQRLLEMTELTWPEHPAVRMGNDVAPLDLPPAEDEHAVDPMRCEFQRFATGCCGEGPRGPDEAVEPFVPKQWLLHRDRQIGEDPPLLPRARRWFDCLGS